MLPASSQLTSSQPMSSAQPPRLDWKADARLITGQLLWLMLATGLMLMLWLMLNTCGVSWHHNKLLV
jgi:hypothetical protein